MPYYKLNPTVLRWGFFVCFFGLSFLTSAQKSITKSWDAQEMETLEIISDEVFRITLISTENPTLTLEALIAGEHAESVMIPVKESNRTLTLGTEFHPFFLKDNDKLAAHKVISIEMRLEVPAHLKVYVEAPIANLKTHGPFKKLTALLRDGHMEVTAFSGNAVLNTREGTINAWATKEVVGRAESKNGKVQNGLPNTGKFVLHAQSVNGDITLRETQE